MNDIIRIAVLMSTYNGEKYIREQINSILNQEGEFQLQLIVRDDGSTDNTQNILNEYAEQGLIQYYIGENLKPTKSFLTLLCNTKGYDYYAYADQDDYWMPNKIINGIRALSCSNIPSIYISNGEIVSENLVSMGRYVYRLAPPTDVYSLLCGAGVQGCAMLFNSNLAQIIQDKGIPAVVTMHDSYIARVCTAIGGKVIYEDIQLLKYRQHAKNVVGVSIGKMNTLKSRVKEILQHENISIASQAQEIIRLYGDIMPNVSLKWYKKVSVYNDTMKSRIALACSTKTRYVTKNWSITIRLKILLGNR